MPRELKTAAVTIRMRPSVRAKLRRLAIAEGRSVTEYIEWLVTIEPERGVPAPEDEASGVPLADPAIASASAVGVREA